MAALTFHHAHKQATRKTNMAKLPTLIALATSAAALNWGASTALRGAAPPAGVWGIAPHPSPPLLLLREKQFLLAHDSATGFVGAGATSPAGIPLPKQFLQTQERNFVGQLNCGARSLDLRLGFERAGEPDLKFHHAQFYMNDQTVANTMPSVISWANAHQTELVVLLLSHCFRGENGGDCTQDFAKPFTDLGIQVVTDKAKLADMTVQEAEKLATLQGGGKVLAVFADDSFVDSTFSAAQNVITKRGFFSTKWNWNLLWEYTNKVKSQTHTRPWQVQGIWQETAAVIESYLGVGYSIKKQTTESKINTKLAEKAEAGYFKGSNFLLMNFVDQEGQRISQAFGASVTDTC